MPLPIAEYSFVMDSPLGSIGILLRHHTLLRVDFLPRHHPPRAPSGRFAGRVQGELRAYFEDPAAGFTVQPAVQGTGFQQRVWQALQAMSPGETLTYGELARQLGSGARAVGNACRHNPVPLIVPCHRLVAAAGMGGYGGRTGDRAIWRKHWLLAHEGAACAGLKIPRPAPPAMAGNQSTGALHA